MKIKNKEQNLKSNKIILLYMFIFFSTLIWSAIKPHDYFTWFLEVFPAIIGFLIIIFTFNKFQLSTFLYTLILIHSIILMIGGHYTYAEVPFFDTLKELFNLERNNFDKLGHFFQGLEPFILSREILYRKNIVTSFGWLNFISLSIVVAFSAIYEIIEWIVAVLTGDEANSFLGTQGYIWDTQSDMAFALIGGVFAWLFLTKTHNKIIKQIIN